MQFSGSVIKLFQNVSMYFMAHTLGFKATKH